MHIEVQPLVGPSRTVEPGGMIEADHPGGIAVEAQRPSADPRPIGGEGEQCSVQVRIVGQIKRDSKPLAMR